MSPDKNAPAGKQGASENIQKSDATNTDFLQTESAAESTSKSKLEHALALARDGYYVFPCNPETNKPIVPWGEASTRNPITIKNWWVCHVLGFEHDYNIGVDCRKSGVTAIDVDVKDGKKGKESYDLWAKEYGWGETRVQETPSGGWHNIYKAQGFKNSVEKLAPGIDVRGDGGFYIAAGSTRHGKEYTLISDVTPKQLPAWLEEKLTALGKAEPVGARDSGKTIVADHPDDIAAAIEFLQNHPPAIYLSGGDTHTYVTFCMLKERGISIQTAIDLADEHWNPRCEPPWDEDDLIKKANSAYKSAHNATGAKSPHAEFDIPKAQPKATVKPLFSLDDAKVGKWLDSSPPVRRWTIKNCLPEGKVGIVAALGATGKSQLIIQLLISVATSIPLAGCWDIGETGSVLALFAEEDTEELHRRLYNTVKSLNLTSDQLELIKNRVFIKSMVAENNYMTSKPAGAEAKKTDYLARLIEVVKQIPDLKLIIIDPISRFRGGNENDNDDATHFIIVLEELAKVTSATVLGLHHASKASAGDKNAAQSASRGASALVDGARWAMNLQTMSPDEAKKYNITETRRGYYVKCMVTKNNYAPPQTDEIWLERGEHGVLSKAILHGSKEDFQEKAQGKIVEIISRDAAQGKEHTRRAFNDKYSGVKNEIGIGEKKLRILIGELLDEGQLALQQPKNPERNKDKVLAVPLSAEEKAEEYRKASDGE